MCFMSMLGRGAVVGRGGAVKGVFDGDVVSLELEGVLLDLEEERMMLLLWNERRAGVAGGRNLERTMRHCGYMKGRCRSRILPVELRSSRHGDWADLLLNWCQCYKISAHLKFIQLLTS